LSALQTLRGCLSGPPNHAFVFVRGVRDKLRITKNHALTHGFASCLPKKFAFFQNRAFTRKTGSKQPWALK
jgi:hypothetical protein